MNLISKNSMQEKFKTNFRAGIASLLVWSRYLTTFLFFLNSYLFIRLLEKIFLNRYIPIKAANIFRRFINPLYLKLTELGKQRRKPNTTPQLSLIDLALKNIAYKKSRSAITILGMTVGIAAVVFLVGSGFGVQKLVIDRSIRLDEMRQADISIQPGTKISITDKSIDTIASFSEVESVEPILNIVAKVKYNNSVTDTPVYAVTREYLELSAIRTRYGAAFGETNEKVRAEELELSQVKGVTLKQKIYYEISPDSWEPVYSKSNFKSKVIGYTSGSGESFEGERIVGGQDSESEPGQIWIRSQFSLWKKGSCDIAQLNCFDGEFIPLLDRRGNQQKAFGYISFEQNSLTEENKAVLGASDGTNVQIELIELEDSEATSEKSEEKTLPLQKQALKEAVINESMAGLLGLEPQEAVGEEFDVSFIVTNELLAADVEKIVSDEANYKITGVVSEGDTPFFYIPLGDLDRLGIINYSQLRIVANDNESLPPLRAKIEAMGYSTTSVADTKEQIDSFFSNLRIVLGVIGSFGLAVAALGMFNTLTVSLLERIKEIGLLKAMGMSRDEVRGLFLTESMIMGFYGGVAGIILGYLMGLAASMILSIFSFAQGESFLLIISIPATFVLIVLTVSFLLGIFTGVYPAQRTTKISALDAWRYE